MGLDKTTTLEELGTDLCNYCANIDSCLLFREIEEQRPIEEFTISANERCHYKRNEIASRLGILSILERAHKEVR